MQRLEVSHSSPSSVSRTAWVFRATKPRCCGTRGLARHESLRPRPAIAQADLDKNVLRGLLSVLHENIEVAIAVEDSGVKQLIFHVAAGAQIAGGDQVIVREGVLGIFVQVLHVRMSGRAIEVEVILFDILAVVALTVRKPKQALLENWILAVPQCHAK